MTTHRNSARSDDELEVAENQGETVEPAAKGQAPDPATGDATAAEDGDARRAARSAVGGEAAPDTADKEGRSADPGTDRPLEPTPAWLSRDPDASAGVDVEWYGRVYDQAAPGRAAAEPGDLLDPESDPFPFLRRAVDRASETHAAGRHGGAAAAGSETAAGQRPGESPAPHSGADPSAGARPGTPPRTDPPEAGWLRPTPHGGTAWAADGPSGGDALDPLRPDGDTTGPE
ncbi:hypothetical protein, partial [Marinitenerispora sediminis]